MTGGVVVVLGRTGRNFAAGMSGGIAYVLDEDKSFEKRCNMSMIELEPVLEEENASWQHYHAAGDLDHHGRVDVMSDMSRYDAERLHQLIANHARYTNSERAKTILAAWNDYLPKFRKVMPVEYRRALAEMKATEVDRADGGGGGVSRIMQVALAAVSGPDLRDGAGAMRAVRAAGAHQAQAAAAEAPRIGFVGRVAWTYKDKKDDERSCRS